MTRGTLTAADLAIVARFQELLALPADELRLAALRWEPEKGDPDVVAALARYDAQHPLPPRMNQLWRYEHG